MFQSIDKELKEQQPRSPSQQYDGQNQNNLPLQPLQSPSKYTDDNVLHMTSPSPLVEPVGTGKAVISLSSVPSCSVGQENKTNSGPLLWLGIDKDANTDTDFTAPIITNKEPSPLTQGTRSSDRPISEPVSKAKGSEINSHEVDAINNHEQQNETIKEEDEQSNQHQIPLSAPEDQGPPVVIDWDEGWQKRLWSRVLQEKAQRERELLLIEEQRAALEEERQNIIQMRYNIEQQRQDLQARENKLIEVEELIPSAKQLKDIGIGFDQALVWIDCIKERAEIERIDERTAAWKLAQDLRAYRDLGGLSKAIQDATQQLAMLNIVNEQQKQAIATLVDLRKAGFSEKEIAELTALVGRWNSRPGLDQNNGSSGTNGSKLDDKLINIGH